MKHNVALFAYVMMIAALFGGCASFSSRSFGCDYCSQIVRYESSQPKVKSVVETKALSRYH